MSENKAKSRTRLKLDLEALLPGDEFLIGTESVTIRPLSVFQYALIIGKVKALFTIAKNAGVTEDNYKDPEQIIAIAEIVIEQFPELLEEISNIAAEDLKQLPLEIIVALIDKCLDVNLKSKESLLGNFKSLIGKAVAMGLMELKESKASQNSSKSSLTTDTTGQA